MFEGIIDVAITKDLTGDLKKTLEELANKMVCVGIPQEEDATRQSNQNERITNAQLLYIHSNGIRDNEMIKEMQHDINSGKPYSRAYEMYVQENGSPLWKVPPRPVLAPAIENSKEIIAQQMQKSLEAVLNGNSVSDELSKIGTIAEKIARNWFISPENGWVPLSARTIEERARRKYKISKYKTEKAKEKYRGRLNAYIAFGEFNPLIDTDELRKSIIYVLRDMGVGQ